MIPITVETDAFHNLELLKQRFRGISFHEKILRLIQCTPIFSKDELKQEVLHNAETYPLSHLFGSGKKSADGRTLTKLSPIDLNNVDSNSENMEAHMHSVALQKEEIIGSTILKTAIDEISSDKILESDLSFLVEDNPIIPSGREDIFRSALYYGITGKLFVALHILAPQVENLFRELAKNCGAITSTLNDDSTSDAKLLTSVFELPELLDCYDNDILFLFQGLMNEKNGANIRNNIAHGLMDEWASNSGASYFFFCWVIKLLSFTARSCYQSS